MTPAELTLVALAWLGTYAVHSTLLLGGIWTWSTWRPIRSPRLRERVWAFGIIGGILTASGQLAVGVDPLLGGLRLESASPAEAASLDAPDSGTIATMTIGTLAIDEEEEGETKPACGIASGDLAILDCPLVERRLLEFGEAPFPFPPAARAFEGEIDEEHDGVRDREAGSITTAPRIRIEERDAVAIPVFVPETQRITLLPALTVTGERVGEFPWRLLGEFEENSELAPILERVCAECCVVKCRCPERNPRHLDREVRERIASNDFPDALLGTLGVTSLPPENPGDEPPLTSSIASKRSNAQLAGTGLATIVHFAKRTGDLPWSRVLLGAWIAAGLAALLGFCFGWAQLIGRLRDRTVLTEGPILEKLDRLRLRAGLARPVRVTTSPTLPGPVTLGLVRREICLPERTLVALTSAQQDAMLGHELAHVVRRDAVRFHILALIERVFFFQPLNRIARREIHDTAEILCDDLAVRWTGRRLALASCLAEIARWIVGAKRSAVPVPGMAEMRSRLGRRIERLLDDRRSPRPEGRHRWLAPLALGLGAMVIAAVPGVSAGTSLFPASGEEATDAPALESVDEATDATTLDPITEENEIEEEEEEEIELVAPVMAEPATLDPLALQSLLVDHRELQMELTILESEMDMIREELKELEFFEELTETFERFDRRVQSLHARRQYVDRLVESLIDVPPAPDHQDPRIPGVTGNDFRSYR